MWTSDNGCWGVASNVRSALAPFTFARAVLLAEVPDSLARRLHSEGRFPANCSLDACLDEVKAARSAALRLLSFEERSRDLRYMPPGYGSQGVGLSDIPFRLIVSSSKAPNFTWSEHLAAGGPMSGHTLGLVLEESFKETVVIARCLSLISLGRGASPETSLSRS